MCLQNISHKRGREGVHWLSSRDFYSWEGRMEQLIPWWGQHRVEMTIYIVEGREEHVGSHQLTPAPEGFTLASWEISFRTCTISDLKCTRTQVQVTQGPGEQWRQKLRDLLEGGWARSRREWWCRGWGERAAGGGGLTVCPPWWLSWGPEWAAPL